MIKLNVNNPKLGDLTIEFDNANEVVNFLDILPNLRTNTATSLTKGEIIEEDLKKSFTAHQDSDIHQKTSTPKNFYTPNQLIHKRNNKKNAFKATDKEETVPSVPKYKNDFSKLKVLDFTLEALANHNGELSPSIIAKMIGRHHSVPIDQGTNLYRYVYQSLMARVKKNIDIIKDGNVIKLKSGYHAGSNEVR